MRILARTLAVLLLGALSIFAAGLPASAAGDTCAEQDPGYGASGVCSVVVADPSAVCLSGFVQLTYKVSTAPDGAATVDLTWVNPAGANVTLTGQPLAGTVTWPASIPKVAVDVQFASGPTTATARVDPAAANASCTASRVLSVTEPATPSASRVLSAPSSSVPAVTSSRVLAATGVEILPFVGVGAGLLIVGTGLLVARAARSRRTGAQQ